ncbi:MAG: hypothetical protein KJ065_26875 [Anaerolineae bacterium]|nr:hypothetical protein [Anaerolineae bacterium]
MPILDPADPTYTLRLTRWCTSVTSSDLHIDVQLQAPTFGLAVQALALRLERVGLAGLFTIELNAVVRSERHVRV